ncbi:Hypothetical protein LOCK908_2095 [Lacticaseibacillus rhamnosus LOCK908]|nr:Hypothetical protein LOCK908_2095 [Lacticaseibacillus rhamnosus LOCK908]
MNRNCQFVWMSFRRKIAISMAIQKQLPAHEDALTAAFNLQFEIGA